MCVKLKAQGAKSGPPSCFVWPFFINPFITTGIKDHDYYSILERGWRSATYRPGIGTTRTGVFFILCRALHMQGQLQTYCIILSSCKQGLNGAYVFPHIYMHMIQGGKKSKYFCRILINMYQLSDFSIIMVHIVNKVNGVSNVKGLVMSLWLRSEVELLFSNIHDSAPALSLRIFLGSAFNYVLNPDEDRNGELQRKAKSGRWCCFIWVHFFYAPCLDIS